MPLAPSPRKITINLWVGWYKPSISWVVNMTLLLCTLATFFGRISTTCFSLSHMFQQLFAQCKGTACAFSIRAVEPRKGAHRAGSGMGTIKALRFMSSMTRIPIVAWMAPKKTQSCWSHRWIDFLAPMLKGSDYITEISVRGSGYPPGMWLCRS